MIPTILTGNSVTDDRGNVSFCNDFDFTGVKRFYTVRNHTVGFVRAWHAHRLEAKFVSVVNGAAIVAMVKIENWDCPAKDAVLYRFVMTAAQPQVLSIPAGYANGFKTLTADAVLMFFSTATVAESRNDDIRFPADYWNPWTIENR